jgi:hypothetical protein
VPIWSSCSPTRIVTFAPASVSSAQAEMLLRVMKQKSADRWMNRGLTVVLWSEMPDRLGRRQGVGVVGAQGSQPRIEDLPEFSLGGGVALVGQHAGDLVPGRQGAAVVGAQYPQPPST